LNFWVRYDKDDLSYYDAVVLFFISDKKLNATSKNFAYKESLVKEMKAFVDSFYYDMINKIHPVIEMRKREIKEMKAKMIYSRKRVRSVRHCEKTRGSVVSSNDSVLTYTEQQFDRPKEMVQLVSVNNMPDQSHLLDLIGLQTFESRL